MHRNARSGPTPTPLVCLKRRWRGYCDLRGDARAALRTTLVANAYLRADVGRLSEAISTGFARGRVRKPATKFRR
jgi:hypothetical protein